MKVLIPAKWGNSPLENVDIFLSTILFAPSKPYSFARATSFSHPLRGNFDSFSKASIPSLGCFLIKS